MNYHQLKQYLFNNMTHGENGRNKNRGVYLTDLYRGGTIPIKFTTNSTGGEFTGYEQIKTILTTPPTGKVWGIDISHWNLPPVNLKRMKDLYGLSFVIIKGCDGTIQSKYFADHVEAARLAGIPYLIYDWLYPGSKVSIDAQTTAWANQYKACPDCKGIRIDAEWTTYAGAAANPSANDLRAAHDSLYKKTNKKSGTYTAKGYADQYLKGFVYKADEPLWVAHYGVTAPSLPIGATTYQMWQFTSTLDGPALDPNGNKELDGDLFNGTAGEFAAQFGTVSEPEPPVEEENMIYINRVNSSISSLRVRTSPDNANDSNVVPNLVLTKGDILVCDQYQNGWYHVFQAVRGSLKISLPAAGCWAGDGTAGTYQDELVKFGVETPPASDVWTKDEKNSLLFDVAEIKADIGNIAGALVSQSQTLAAILNKLDTPTTPPPANDLLDYTGPYAGEYEVIDDGNTVKWMEALDSYSNNTSQMSYDTAKWCQDIDKASWDYFVNQGVLTKNADGLWFTKLRVYRGSIVRIGEVNTQKNTGRIIGFSISTNQPTSICVHTPALVPWLRAKVQGQPYYYYYVQPWRTPSMTVDNAIWFDLSKLKKVA